MTHIDDESPAVRIRHLRIRDISQEQNCSLRTATHIQNLLDSLDNALGVIVQLQDKLNQHQEDREE